MPADILRLMLRAKVIVSDSGGINEEAPTEHHDHLINLDTGAVIEFRSEEIEALQTEIARRLAQLAEEAEVGQRAERRMAHHQVARGDSVRVFIGPDFREK